MTATNDFQKIVNSLTEEMREQIDDDITSRRGTTKQEHDSLVGAENLEFRPLTKEEKEEFLNSLDAKGRQILEDLAGESKRSESKDSDGSKAGAAGRK